MSLIAEIEDELKDAMRARDAERRDALRLILNALKGSQKELQRPLTEDEELQVLQRERKRRLEAAEAFRSGGREEQAVSEERELEILEEFMPEPLSEDEVEEIVDDVIAEVGATSMADLGRVMADVMPQVAGRADGSAGKPDRPREARLETWGNPGFPRQSPLLLRVPSITWGSAPGRARSPLRARPCGYSQKDAGPSGALRRRWRLRRLHRRGSACGQRR